MHADSQKRSLSDVGGSNRSTRASLRFGIAALLSAATAFITPPQVFAAATIDLATDQNSVHVFGPAPAQLFGSWLASCDLNGDGVPELVVAAPDSSGPDGSRFGSGTVHVLLGERRAWQGDVSLPSSDAMVVWGEEPNDLASEALACGDVNQDGFDDLVIGAEFGDGPSNSRDSGGQAHIVLGSANLPPTMDLLVTNETVIWGDVADSRLGHSLAVCDLNGDGVMDVVLGAYRAPAKITTKLRAGRAYIEFGRQSWPATIDLRTQADVTIFGKNASDALSGYLTCADISGDGTADLLLGMTGGDGVGGSRVDSGEVVVFKGRSSWPLLIDLATTGADMRVLGVDANDHLPSFRSVAVADLDGDGHPEIVAGSQVADGRGNTAADAGETRTYEPFPGFPSVVDLALNSRSVIYGVNPLDLWAGVYAVGDFNGDGTDDFAGSSTSSDGPDGTRIDAGEVMTFFGRAAFTMDTDYTQADLRVFGHAYAAEMAIRGTSDVNGDGLREIAALSDFQNGRNGSVWLVSAADTDGDGIQQLSDNCPLVYNPGQSDSNADRRGDTCALDWDGDSAPDTEDCQPAVATAGTPREVTSVRFEAASKTILRWDSLALANNYDVSRGSLPVDLSIDYGSCRNSTDPNLTDTQFIDPVSPGLGSGFYYLVRGRNSACLSTGSWGHTSSGGERSNTNPLGCP